jgi:hypothetical protein
MTGAILPIPAANMPLDPPAETAAGQRRRSPHETVSRDVWKGV